MICFVMRFVRICVLIEAMGLLCPTGFAAEHTQARLLLAVESARPGDVVMAAVELRMEGNWHTYWRNGGDSGAPTKIAWQLPEGITAGAIQWPVPEKDVTAGLTTYVYRHEAMLLVPLTIAEGVPAGTRELRARISWLECDEVCVPGSAEVQTSLLVGSETKPSTEADRIRTSQKKIPGTSLSLNPEAFWESGSDSDTRPLMIRWKTSPDTATADFYPYATDDFEVSGPTERVGSEAGIITLRKPVLRFGDTWPTQVRGLLVTQNSEARMTAYEVTMPVGVSGETQAAQVPELNKQGSMEARVGGAAKSLWKMLLLAFVGGLILNIMPCVLPVIALKVLGFVNQSRESPGRVRQLSGIYALGVVTSFLALAAVVIGVQQAGRAASWGMQFQNPQFLIGMTVLVTLVALNLFGLFEITLSGGAMGAASNLASREGAGGAFFHGVLATALATPCTAPFLGVALGFAFSQPPGIIALMFATIGLGLAMPYVVLSWNPSWLRFIPKPGVWMVKFKIAMGFPMLATAFWLLWLSSSHFGRNGILWIGIFLVLVAMAVWIWGDFVQKGSSRRSLAVACSLATLAGAYFLVLEKQLHWRAPVGVDRMAGSGQHMAGGISWETWSPEALMAARTTGRPVLVDFTADWCVTCQVNKRTSLEIPAVREKLKSMNAIALLGDYTSEDAAIAAELKRYERAGVPLVLIYPPGVDSKPYVLPEILTPDIVLGYLEKAAAPIAVARGS
jgi:thiol:disulfide interchange protein/DsbC/DsbD-like thiol-disulfide interchange protein